MVFVGSSDVVKKKFIVSSIQLIKRKKTISELEEKKLRYGLEGFYNLATKTVVLLILAIILDLIPELLLLTAIYSTLRMYGFGIHMKTSLQCWFTTVPIYIGGCLLIKYFVFPDSFNYLIWIFGFLSFLFFAPADTPARPLIRRNKRIRAKVLAMVIFVCYFVLFSFTNDTILSNTIVYAVIIESISINPLTYKLFHTSFNNYKKYPEFSV